MLTGLFNGVVNYFNLPYFTRKSWFIPIICFLRYHAYLTLADFYESPEGPFEIRNSMSKTTNQEKAFKLRIVYGQ
jgi:hypothetical protein